MKTKLCAVMLGSTLPLALSSGTAGATTPMDNVRSSGNDSFVATHTCSDPIRVDSSWDIMVHTRYDSSGVATRIQITGPTTITYTDLVNGDTYSPNSSGPATFDLATGQGWLRGSSGAVFDAAGVLVATSGRIVEDADGNIISITGIQRPVCAVLHA